MADIKLITFDLDNTLWNVETVIRAAETRMRDWVRDRVPDYHVRFPAEALLELRNAVVEERPELRHDLSALREELLYRAFLQCGTGRRDARALARQAFEIFLDARHEVEYFDGALETLERLSGDYVLGALTNGNADIGRLDLQRYFDFGYSAASVGAGKPAPDMFRAALRHVDAAPAQAVHVGDHVHDDVAGAAAVGMHTVWINAAGDPLPEDVRPSITVAAIREVAEAVAALHRDH